MSSYDWGDADAQKWARVSRLGAKNSVAVAGKLAFVPRANAQDERKHCYAVLLIQRIDPSITFALLASLWGIVLREHQEHSLFLRQQ